MVLALDGGGVGGAAQIGMLRVLNKKVYRLSTSVAIAWELLLGVFRSGGKLKASINMLLPDRHKNFV